MSRISRDTNAGYELYKGLFDKGVRLVFINELYIDTDVYRDARNTFVPLTGTDIDLILYGLNQYLMCLAEQQIKLTFV